MGLLLCRSFRFSRGRYGITRKDSSASQKSTTWMVFSFLMVRFHPTHLSNDAYMQILPHNTDLSVNLIKLVLLLLCSALLILSSLRFIKILASIYHTGAHVDNFVHLFKWATSQFLFTNIDGELPRSKGLTRLCGSHVAVDSKHIKWRKSCVTISQKILYLLVIFSFAHLMAS